MALLSRATLVLCTGYAFILLILCYFLPFSQLFRIVHTYDDLFHQVEKTTKQRHEIAEEYFESLDPKQSREIYNNRLRNGNLTFAIGIITIARIKSSKEQHKSFGYLVQSTALLDRAIKQHPFFSNAVPFICNVDIFPQNHQDAVQLYQFMPYTERYHNNSLGVGSLIIPNSDKLFKDMITHSSKYDKETFDYTFCLMSAAALKPQYIILIEDDTLPHRDYPVVLEHLLTSRLKLAHGYNHRDNFAYFKLYYPSKWQGFAFEFRSIIDLLSWSIVGATMFKLVHSCYTLYYKLKGHQKQARLFILGFLISLFSCWLLGRQNVNELRRISKYLYRLQSSEGCCTQAMLYPFHIVDSLSQYLTTKSSSKHTDLAILDFSTHYKLPTLQVEPSLFYHIGLHTTLDLAQKHPEEFIVPV